MHPPKALYIIFMHQGNVVQLLSWLYLYE